MQPVDKRVPYGCSIALECVVRSNGLVTYTWHKGSHAIPGMCLIDVSFLGFLLTKDMFLNFRFVLNYFGNF